MFLAGLALIALIMRPGQIWHLSIEAADRSLWLRATFHGTTHISAHSCTVARHRPSGTVLGTVAPVHCRMALWRCRTALLWCAQQGGTFRRLSQLGLHTMSSVLRKGSLTGAKLPGVDVSCDYDAVLDRCGLLS